MKRHLNLSVETLESRDTPSSTVAFAPTGLSEAVYHGGGGPVAATCHSNVDYRSYLSLTQIPDFAAPVHEGNDGSRYFLPSGLEPHALDAAFSPRFPVALVCGQ